MSDHQHTQDLIRRRDLLRANAAGNRQAAATCDELADAINAELSALSALREREHGGY